MASLLEQLPPFGDSTDVENNIPKSFLNALQELYNDGRLTSWKVRGQGDILSVRLTWSDPNHRNSCIKAKAHQHLGSVISYVTYDKNVKRELREYATRINLLVDKLQADLAERNAQNNHRSIRGKSKEGLKAHQQLIATEIARARGAVSGPLRRSNSKSNVTHERELHNLIVQQTEEILQTNLQNFQKALSAPNSNITSSNFDQKLAQAIFDKCVSKEIFQELPEVIDTSRPPTSLEFQRQPSNTSSLTSLTKPSSFQPTWSNTSPQTATASWEIKSRNDNIRKVKIPKVSIATEEEDTEKVIEDEEEPIRNNVNHTQPITSSQTIEFGNGLKLDLSSIDGETSTSKNNRHSVDSDLEAINRSISRVGEWQTNFTLVESKSSPHSGEETSRSNREAVFLTIPTTNYKQDSPRVGDKPLEDLADDDLYANESSSSYPLPINTTTVGEQSQFSDNDSTNIRKFFPLPANLLLQNHSSCSFRRPSYTYESDNESVISSIPSVTEMKTLADEEKFRMDPSIKDPKFILRPKDSTVRCGETAKFKVKVTGTEPVDVFWFRFGTDEEIVNDEKYELSHDDTYHYLKIYSTNKDDQGAYLCVIANDKAQNVDIAKLFVKDNKRSFNSPQLLQEFYDVDVDEGSPLTLKCKMDHGYPKSRILWYRENSLIQPNQHYKLYYYGNGQHALHVDEATIEDDNGTFTCLALNAAGRVQITADVFVHEKEVIDIPRDSPSITSQRRVLKQQEANRQHITMDQDEDEAPTISRPMSPLSRNPVSDNEEEESAKRYMDKFKTDRSSKLLENWRNLYEASVHSLQSDDDETNPVMQQPFYLNRQPSIEHHMRENARSPILQAQTESNPLKSKWEIRLPELLNRTVGPDRQKRDSTRRHTTAIILDQEQQHPSAFTATNKNPNTLSQSLSSSTMPDELDGDRPSSPLVKHLKQKFDRMSTTDAPTEHVKTQPQSHSGPSKVHRVGNKEGNGVYPLLPVASLTCRGLTSNGGDRSAQKTRPMLPIRVSTDQEESTKQKTVRSESSDNYTKINNDRYPKGKTNPPISYSQNLHPARSTTSVVKDLINGGNGSVTLVYDSLIQNNTLHATAPPLQNDYCPNQHHQQEKKEHVRLEQTKQCLKTNLINKNNANKNLSTLTGRQIQPSSSHNAKTINAIKQPNIVISDDDSIKNPQNSLLAKDSFNRSTSTSDKISNPEKSISHKSNGTTSNSNTHVPSNNILTTVPRKTVLARAELWDRRISTNENESTIKLSTYEIEQWSSEFEKIQNQN